MKKVWALHINYLFIGDKETDSHTESPNELTEKPLQTNTIHRSETVETVPVNDECKFICSYSY